MEDDNSNSRSQWSASLFAPLPAGTSPDSAWSLVGDYANLHLWLPSVPTCRVVEGTNNTPGCVRYCAAPPADDGSVLWANERLVGLDPVGRSYSYVITESNMGLTSYEATLGVVADPANGDRVGLEWRFESDAVPGLTRGEFVEYLEVGLKAMAERVGDALREAEKEDLVA